MPTILRPFPASLISGLSGVGFAFLLALTIPGGGTTAAFGAVSAETEPRGNTAPETTSLRALIGRIQSALALQGFYSGPIDGHMGPATDKAIRAYQKQAGQPYDGRITSELAHQMETGARVGSLLNRLEKARQERIHVARESLLSRPETRDLTQHIDDIADPTRDAAPCFRQPTPQCLLAEATESAKGIYKPEMRDWALGEVLVSQAKAGLTHEAMQTVRRIRDPRLIMAALRNIAEAQARAGRISDALEAADIIPDIEQQAEALIAIAEIEVRTKNNKHIALDQLDALIGQINDSQKQIDLGARTAVIFWQANKRPDAELRILAATKLAEHETSESARNISLGHVAIAYANMGRPAQAIKIMQKVRDTNVYEPVLISAATAHAEAGSMTEALSLADNIDAVRYRAVVLSQIAVAQARAGDEATAESTLQRALSETGTIMFPFAKDFAMSRIALAMRDFAIVSQNGKQLAMFDLAVSTAGNIKDNQLRSRVLWSISADRRRAGDEVGATLTQAIARRSTDSIKSALSRVWMYGDIALEHARLGEMAAAREAFKTGLLIAEDFQNAWGRARALGKLAQALVQISETDTELSERPGP